MTARLLHRPHAPDLFLRIVRPRAVRSRLLFVHASTVHSEYYLPLAARLARHGVETWLPDLRGHGRSGGTRGHTRDWRHPVDDVACAWEALRAEGQAPPAVAGGESYGAFLAYCAIRSKIIEPDGAVFLSPAFGLHFHPSRLGWWLLTRGLWPVAARLRPLQPLPLAGVTRDPAVLRMIDRDPLCNRHYTLGFALHLLTMQNGVPKPDPEWRLATLLLLSEHDPVTDNLASRAVFENNPAVTWRIGDRGLHSLVADQPDWVAETVAGWLRERPASGLPPA